MQSNDQPFWTLKHYTEMGNEFRAYVDLRDPTNPIRMEYGFALNSKKPELQEFKWSLTHVWHTNLTPLQAMDVFLEEVEGQFREIRESLSTPEIKEVMYKGYRLTVDAVEDATVCMIGEPYETKDWKLDPLTRYRNRFGAVEKSPAHALWEARKIVNQLIQPIQPIEA
jgi:hypothetical protein